MKRIFSVLVLLCTCLPASAMLNRYSASLAQKAMKHNVQPLFVVMQKKMNSNVNMSEELTQAQLKRIAVSVPAAYVAMIPGGLVGMAAGIIISEVLENDDLLGYSGRHLGTFVGAATAGVVTAQALGGGAGIILYGASFALLCKLREAKKERELRKS